MDAAQYATKCNIDCTKKCLKNKVNDIKKIIFVTVASVKDYMEKLQEICNLVIQLSLSHNTHCAGPSRSLSS